MPGTKLAGRYRIVALLGQGGMGEVYRADDLKLGEPVALKFLSTLGTDQRRLELFHDEVRLSRQITHPNICRVYDIGEVDGLHFLSMEYIDGEDLKSLLKRIGRLPKDKGIQIAQQLCAGLAAAHDKGVLHRDLKPANIMIDGKGHALITDFGVATVADEGQEKKLVGTPAYMAPEQLAEGETTARSDLYSLGLILYELFTGQRAHKGNTPIELLAEHEDSSGVVPSTLVEHMDPAVERVILQCLAKDPALRPKSAGAVAAALPGGDPLAAALAAGETPSPEMIAAAGQAGALTMRHGVGLLVATLALLIALPNIAQSLGRIDWSSVGNNSPAVLERDALQWVEQLGYGDPDADRVSQLSSDKDDYALEYLFRQRQSPRTIDPMIFRHYGHPEWKPTLDNPSVLEPGMISLRLDPARKFMAGGQLLEFLAVPDGATTRGDWVNATEGAWDKFFESAGFRPFAQPIQANGLNRYGFADITSKVTEDDTVVQPPVFADRVSYWATDPGATTPDLIMATSNNRPVYFRQFDADAHAVSRLMARESDETVGHALSTLITFGAALILAFFNLKAGRADTKGGFRLVVFYFAGEFILWTIVLRHQLTSPAREFFLDLNYLIFASGRVFRTWVYFIALEPYVRRYWPNVLISWSRVLTGRFRDPQVGRDLMVGCLFGLMLATGLQFCSHHPRVIDVDLLADGSALLGHAVSMHQETIRGGLYYLALLLILRIACRNMILAGICFVIFIDVNLSWMIGLQLGLDPWILGAAWAACLVILLARFGLLSIVAFYFTVVFAQRIPHTTDFDAWYGVGSRFTLAVMLVIVGYGFYTSTIRPYLTGRQIEGG